MTQISNKIEIHLKYVLSKTLTSLLLYKKKKKK